MENYSEDQRLLDAQDEVHRREKRTKFFLLIKQAQSKTSRTSKKLTQLAQSYTDYVMKWNDGVIPTLGCWLVWNFVGTMFYGAYDFHSYSKGFYFAINVGYSIGWGTLHEQTLTSKTFSIFYLLVGAIFVSRWLAHLMTHAIRDSDDAYQNLLVKKRLRAQTQLTGPWADIYIFLVMNHPKLFSIYLWCVYIAFGTSWSVCSLHWTVTEGVYFAISSMSTGMLCLSASCCVCCMVYCA
ncbi:two pore domain potassium channel family protein [archaeon]|nr:MAG: two pore domain potassium channel family protein [archaeon]